MSDYPCYEKMAVCDRMGCMELYGDAWPLSVGAAKSVWPRRLKGVQRKELIRKPKLAAANGTDIKVYGEAMLEFENSGRRCGMKFLDSDVKKPLASDASSCP